MHDYDVAMKNLLMKPGSLLLEKLTGAREVRWLNVEVPRVRNTRRDLIGELPDSELVGIEIQVENEPDFGFRIGEYQFGTARMLKRMPRQVVLFIGPDRLTMPDSTRGADHYLRWHFVDVRELDGEALLDSPHLGDNVVAVLTRLGTQAGVVRKVLERIATGPGAERGEALTELAILSGLRRLSEEVREEASRMPVTYDLMENAVFGPSIREGLARGLAEGMEKGIAQGLEQGLLKGRVEGQLEILTTMIEGRFGKPLPAGTLKRLTSMSAAQLTATGLRLFDAHRIEDLFA